MMRHPLRSSLSWQTPGPPFEVDIGLSRVYHPLVALHGIEVEAERGRRGLLEVLAKDQR